MKVTKHQHITEKELLDLLKMQSEDGIIYLYDRYASSIYGIILKEVKNARLASEILRATFINIFRECKNIDCVKRSMFAWVLQHATQTAKSQFQVNIDVKSLVSQNVVTDSYVPSTKRQDTNYNSVSSYLNFNTSIY